MDQGLNRSFKAHYQKRVIRKLIISLDKKVSLQKISMLDVMNMIVFSWIDGNSPFKELRKELLQFRKSNGTKHEMSAGEFLGLGENVCTTEEHPITNE